MRWKDLTPAMQRRLQQPRNKLTKEERKLRKELFWKDYWRDAGGNKHCLKRRIPAWEKVTKG